MKTLALYIVLLAFVSSSVAISLAEETPPKPEKWRSVVYVHRQPESGLCLLKGNEYLLRQTTAKPREFEFRSLWRYEPATKKWVKVKQKAGKPAVIQPVIREIYSYNTDPTLVSLPEWVGLFWLEWSEDGHKVNGIAVSGPVLCNDIPLTKPPKGMIWACVPFQDRAWATSVPNPRIHCRD